MPSSTPSVDQSGHVAIVTGGARGLGRAMALGLLRDGFRVVITHLPTSAAEMQALNILAAREGWESRLFAVESDVTKWEQCRQTVERSLEHFGALHGLVNNAGIGMQGIGNVLVGERKPFYEVEADAWRRVVDVNINGAFLMAKAATPHLVKQGWGRIVNIETSLYAMMMDGFSPYGPSKAALEIGNSHLVEGPCRNRRFGECTGSWRSGGHTYDSRDGDK